MSQRIAAKVGKTNTALIDWSYWPSRREEAEEEERS